MVNRYYLNRIGIYILGILAGMFAQSRLPIVIFVFLLVIGSGVNRNAAKRFAIAAALVCSAFYVGFFLWTVKDHLYSNQT